MLLVDIVGYASCGLATTQWRSHRVPTTNTSPPVEPDWIPDEADFPARGSVEDAITFCLRYAVLAASGHNSQPWWFKVDDTAVTVGLDVSRGLAVADPLDREATISVGAAIMTLRIALAHFGLQARVDDWPDPKDPEACATVTVTSGASTDETLEPLFGQITQRRSSHAGFDDTPVDDAVLAELAGEAAAEGAALHSFTTADDRQALAELVAEADQEQMSDLRFRRELASWLRRPFSRQRDGLHGYTVGSPLEEVALTSPLIVRTFDVGKQRGAHNIDLVGASPVIAILSTAADDRSAWLDAGRAIARTHLRASRAGLSVGFLNQAIEVPATRAKVGEIIGAGAVPQILLRLGYGPPVPAQPRRPLERFLID